MANLFTTTLWFYTKASIKLRILKSVSNLVENKEFGIFKYKHDNRVNESVDKDNPNNVALTTSSAITNKRFCVLRFALDGMLPSGVTVLPILSLPIQIFDSSAQSNDNYHVNPSKSCDMSVAAKLADSVYGSCIRECCMGDRLLTSIDNENNNSTSIENSSESIYVLESAGSLGIGGKVWDSTYILLDYLRVYGSHLITGKKVVELGSGTGIAGNVCCDLLWIP